MTISFTIVNISNCGGTERVMLSIASGLSRLGYDVHVLSHYGNGKPFFRCDGRIKIHTLLSALETRYLSTHSKYLIWKCKLFFRWIKPDVVVDTDLLTPNITIPALCGSAVRHLAWDNMSYEYFKKATPERLALDKMVEYGSHLLVLTKQDQQSYICREAFPEHRVHQIYNPLTIEESSYQTRDATTVLSVGRFANEKGFDLLMKAWKIVEQSNSDWHLEIWGDTGLDTGEVHNTFASLQLARVSLNGTTPDIVGKFRDSSIYVLSSRYEPFGLVLLEASACSLPLIAFDCPNGPREIIRNGENGILVEPENVEALAAAILRLIGNKELRERLGKNAYERSKDFSMDVILREWERLLAWIIHPNPGGVSC